MFTRIRGASNAKARRELEWVLIYPRWREGFVEGLAAPLDPDLAAFLVERAPDAAETAA